MISPISLKGEFAEQNEDEYAQHVNHEVAKHLTGENLPFAYRGRRKPCAGSLPDLPGDQPAGGKRTPQGDHGGHGQRVIIKRTRLAIGRDRRLLDIIPRFH
ncbi:hypothetical protein D3C81_1410130 [compost metagenome]